MASWSISEENPAAMAASSSAKVAFNLCSFPTSLFPAAHLPLLLLLLLLPAHLPLLALQLPYHIVSQVSAATSRKPNHDWILVSTALTVLTALTLTATVLGMLVCQLYFITRTLYVANLILLLLSSRRPYECLSLLIFFAPYFLLHC